MRDFKDDVSRGKTANDFLTEKIKEVSIKLLDETYEFDEGYKLSGNLEDYYEFIKVIIDVLNLSNSRQAPKSANIFTFFFCTFALKFKNHFL